MIKNICPACNFKAETSFETCPKCGVIVRKFIEKQVERHATTTTKRVEQKINQQTDIVKYPSLQFILMIVKFSGLLLVLLSVITFFTPGVPAAGSFAALTFSVLCAILLWGGTESVQVFIDMEENQRKLIKILLDK